MSADDFQRGIRTGGDKDDPERIYGSPARDPFLQGLDAFPVGTRVNVLSKGDTWCKVRVSGKTGYMMTKYLYSGSGSSGGGSGTTKYVWTPTGTTLNLRSEPNSWSAILGSYRVGTRVTVLKSGRMWSRVSVNGKIGYMYSDYLVNSR